MLNLGGGFLPHEADFRRKAMCIRGVKMEIDAEEKDRKGGPLPAPGIRWVAEPGRFFATSAFDFFVQVIGKKPNLTNGGWRYTIDESLYGQFSCIPFDHKVPQWIRIPTSYEKKDHAARKRVKGTLYGRTCDSLDMIADSKDMEDLEVGDWLWFPNMGAYSSVTASEFNGFPKPPMHGTDRSLFVPPVEQLKLEGYADRFPKEIQTVTAVSIESPGPFTCPAVA